MSIENASFTDPNYLATYGLNRTTAVDYFLHPLNPFRTKNKCTNDILNSQQISISWIMVNGIGVRPGPLTIQQAEEEMQAALAREHNQEQYELIPVDNPGSIEAINSPLFTIRHVYRESETKVVPLGIYYILEGVIYKSPCARSLMKANIARTTSGLMDACDMLKHCARYSPRTGYYFDFDGLKKKKRLEQAKKRKADEGNTEGREVDPLLKNKHITTSVYLEQELKKELANPEANETVKDILNDFKQRTKILRDARRLIDNRPAGERTEEEEEGIRAKEKMNSILMSLKSSIQKV